MRRWMRAALAGALWAGPAPAMTLSLPAVVTELDYFETVQSRSTRAQRVLEGRSFLDDGTIVIGDEFVLSFTVEGPIERVFDETSCLPDSQTLGCYRTGDQTARLAVGSYTMAFSSVPISAGRSALTVLDNSTILGPEPLDAVQMNFPNVRVESTQVDLPFLLDVPGREFRPAGDEPSLFADRSGTALSSLDFEFPRTLLAFGEFDVLVRLGCAASVFDPKCVPAQELGADEFLVRTEMRLVAHVVPEPSTALLLAAGLGVLGVRRNRH